MSRSTPLPVIQKALGARFDHLGSIVKRHYNLVPGTSSTVKINGTMSEVYHSKIAKLFLLPGRLFGALVHYKGKNIPTEVRNWTTYDDSKAMFWYRTLHFPGKSPIIFHSRMEHINNNEIIEYVNYGMGIRMLISEHDAILKFIGIGYLWKIGSITLSIPNWMMLGDAVITEKAISEKMFTMDFKITHPLFGRTFSYHGDFSIVE
ncbi:MAG: DUF4166 domain-containing protein [Candidatus Thiodiazotropha sp. (ex Codakia rugifera)]|nr:DUF4166 domain-containing protein [Candidatus Thiodiazotropha sp. (ex Codakia rugifera)]